MHIILGYELDTGSPDALGNDEARQGVVVLGPAGLVGVLETRLGLTRIQTHQAIRIGQYLKRLKEADNNERFYSKSIRVDAWLSTTPNTTPNKMHYFLWKITSAFCSTAFSSI